MLKEVSARISTTEVEPVSYKEFAMFNLTYCRIQCTLSPLAIDIINICIVNIRGRDAYTGLVRFSTDFMSTLLEVTEEEYQEALNELLNRDDSPVLYRVMPDVYLINLDYIWKCSSKRYNLLTIIYEECESEPETYAVEMVKKSKMAITHLQHVRQKRSPSHKRINSKSWWKK